MEGPDRPLRADSLRLKIILRTSSAAARTGETPGWHQCGFRSFAMEKIAPNLMKRKRFADVNSVRHGQGDRYLLYTHWNCCGIDSKPDKSGDLGPSGQLVRHAILRGAHGGNLRRNQNQLSIEFSYLHL